MHKHFMKQMNNVLLMFAFAIWQDKLAEMRHEMSYNM